MKTTFHPSTKKRKNKAIFAGVAIALFFIALIYGDKSFYLLEPFLKIKKKIETRYKEYLLIFSEKKGLQEENSFLREEISKLETENALNKKLKEENELLKNAFSADEKKNFLLAAVISRPPFSPYDMLIIDAGRDKDLKEGMQVSAFGNVLLGYVTDIFDYSSKVKLISSWGEETNVVLESGLPAVAVGRGGENFEITLSRAVIVKIGERITTLGISPLLVGIVEKIEHQPTDPFQKIFFRLPLNIQYLQHVFLLKK